MYGGLVETTSLLLFLILLVTLPYSLELKCYECVWIQGRTDSSCLHTPPRELLVDCDRYDSNSSLNDEDNDSKSEEAGAGGEAKDGESNETDSGNAAGDDLSYDYCEVAIGCLDRGFGKRQSLHRTCSSGPNPEVTDLRTGQAPLSVPNVLDDSSLFDIEDDLLSDGKSAQRQLSPSPQQTSNASAECELVGDGDTQDGSVIMNLRACYCRSDGCNNVTGKRGENFRRLRQILDDICDSSVNLRPQFFLHSLLPFPFLTTLNSLFLSTNTQLTAPSFT